MGTKYSSVSVTGYNSSPPADDGTAVASNQVKWSTIKTKLPDPLKTAIEAINTALVTATDYSHRAVTVSDSTVAGDHMKTVEIASTATTGVTISLGDAATMTANYVVRVFNASAHNQTIGRATVGNTINGTAGNVTIPSKVGFTFSIGDGGTNYEIVGVGVEKPATTDGTQTLTSKTINLNANTLTGTKAEFNTACSDGDFGDIVGPGSATDNAVVRFDSTTGKLVQNSGVTIDDSNNLSSPGSISVTGSVLLGYGTGAGGTVTQGAGSGKATQVTLNKPTGQITMNNAALAAGAIVTFQVLNSLVARTDHVHPTICDGAAASGTYRIDCTYTQSGFYYLTLQNISGGSLSEAVVINVAIIKGATS